MDNINIEKLIKSEIVDLSKKKITMVDINDNTNLIYDLGFDSVLIVQLMLEMENKFDIIFEDEDLTADTFTIYKNIKEIILKKVC